MKSRKPPLPPFDPYRRRLLAGLAAGTASAAGLVGCGGSSSSASPSGAAAPALSTLPAPADSGIDHVVVVMMENRSFDHYFGWLPGADGRQAGLGFNDSDDGTQTSRSLAPNYQNCDSADPDHSYEGGRTHVNNGAMDGFLLTQPVGDSFPIGYYGADDLPFFKGCADHWTVCDRYFSGILSSTYPNRIYMHAGQTDRITNTADVSTLPTVWDSLQDAGHTGRYYFQDLPITALWGARYLGITQPYALFKLEAAAGALADVSYIDPAFLGEAQGTSRDDHPLADIRDGQAFLNDVYNTLRSSPAWERTLLVINYDEWGGFFDHVEPPFAPVTGDEFDATGNDGRLGIRVPCVIAGPRARRGHVEHLQFDPNSILNLIAWRFGFDPLGARASSINLAHALDFDSAADSSAPAFDVGAGPFGIACVLQPSAMASYAPQRQAEVLARQQDHVDEWRMLQTMARQYGFPV